MIYHYKNGKGKTISLSLLQKLIKIAGISKKELKENIKEIVSLKNLRQKELKIVENSEEIR